MTISSLCNMASTVSIQLYLIILLLIYFQYLPDVTRHLEEGFVLFWRHHVMVVISNISEIHWDTIDMDNYAALRKQYTFRRF